jgi:hypothetical protein
MQINQGCGIFYPIHPQRMGPPRYNNPAKIASTKPLYRVIVINGNTSGNRRHLVILAQQFSNESADKRRTVIPHGQLINVLIWQEMANITTVLMALKGLNAYVSCY